MTVNELVDHYLSEIIVESTEYVPWDDASHDCANVCLIVPAELLREYQKLKSKPVDELPDGPTLWKESGLVTKLQGFKVQRQYEPLGDILEFLHCEVRVDFQHLTAPSFRYRMSITEIPREVDED